MCTRRWDFTRRHQRVFASPQHDALLSAARALEAQELGSLVTQVKNPEMSPDKTALVKFNRVLEKCPIRFCSSSLGKVGTEKERSSFHRGPFAVRGPPPLVPVSWGTSAQAPVLTPRLPRATRTRPPSSRPGLEPRGAGWGLGPGSQVV